MLFNPSSKSLLLAILAIVPSALGQTFTSCNPLNKTDCPTDLALGVKNYTINFRDNTPSDKVWNTTAGVINYGTDGAEFTINQKGDSPTIKSEFYIFFGTVEVLMKAAKGQGVISSIVLESDDLDEVDCEWMGGNTTSFETNYFGKGDTSTFDRAIYYDVDTPMDDFHNYTIDWNHDRIEWYADSVLLRTLNYSDAQNGTRFPQTPMNIRLGVWAGGDPSEPNGTIEWAGGRIDYSKAPFTMTVQSVRVTDKSNATAYEYGNESGDWQSIKLLEYHPNPSTNKNQTSTKPIPLDGSNSQTTTQKAKSTWDGLSKTAKIAIGGSAAGVALLGVCALTFCCIKQRKIGRRERQAADAEYEKQTAELLQYRAEMNRQRSEQMTDGSGPHMGGIGGRMKRMSQSLGIGRNQGGYQGGYQGEYQRF